MLKFYQLGPKSLPTERNFAPLAVSAAGNRSRSRSRIANPIAEVEEFLAMIGLRSLFLTFALLFGGICMSADAQAQGQSAVASFEINADTTMPARTASFGQVFLPGAVLRSDHLQAMLDAHAVPTQIDPKAFNQDGSIRHAIVTIELPKLRSGQSLNAAIVKQSDTGPAAAPPAMTVPALDVVVKLKGPDGSVRNLDVNLQAVAQNPRNAAPGFWISGPLAQERRFMADANDHLQILFDVFTPRQGPARVDVIFHNDWTGIHRRDDLAYDVEMRLAGAVVYQARGVRQYPFSTWHRLLWTDGKPSVRVAQNLALLEAAAAVPRYATDFSIHRDFLDQISRAAGKIGDDAMTGGMVDAHMPDTGGRMDIGPLPTWAVIDLRQGDESSRKVLLANADAAGTIPWHLRDRKTGLPLTIDAHPGLWLDSRGGDTVQGLLPEAFDEETNGWTIDDAHQPSLTYLPYLLTGSQYYRDELAAQAAFDLARYDPDFRGQSHGLIIGEHGEAWQQVRGLSWSLRTLANAAFILPASDPLRGYFDAKLRANLAKLAELFVQNRVMKSAGALEGWVPGDYRPEGATAPWQQGFLATVLTWINDMGYPDAGRTVGWMSNFIAGLFTNGDQGFDPSRGAAYILNVYDPDTRRRFNSWAEAFGKTGLNAQSAKDADESWTEYGMIMLAGTASVYSTTASPRAKAAYEFVLSRAKGIGYPVAKGDPTFAIMPRQAH